LRPVHLWADTPALMFKETDLIYEGIATSSD